MLQFIKNWTLPLAMLAGIIGYYCFSTFSFLYPLKPFVGTIADYLTPFLIFSQLLLTFCKIEIRDLAPTHWHGWLLLYQLVSAGVVAGVLYSCPLNELWRITLEGILVCLICPTATAAAVVTGKLGGNAAALTTYTLASNLLAATFVPLVFPLVEPSTVDFSTAFLSLLGKVFPLLLFPFFLALFLKCFLPKVHCFLMRLKDMAFYLWAVALTIVMAQTTRSVMEGTMSFSEELLVAGFVMVVCIFLFAIGKSIGGRYQERISGGQALGQKNTVLAIWMAYTYLNPASAIAPGSYVLWQNIINSYQLWKKRKNGER